MANEQYLDANGLNTFWGEVKSYVDRNGGTGDTTYLVRAPVGTIVIWSGTADNIPTGWQLCDGTNGTPDLRDKFVLVAGTEHGMGETGGSEEVTLTEAQMPTHYHLEQGDIGGSKLRPIISNAGAGPAVPGGQGFYFPSQSTYTAQSRWANTTSTGLSQPHPNMPPYYALCYIMKLTADATDGVTQAELIEALEGKQDTLTGTAGQLVGFDAQGNAVAQNAGEIYSTEETRIGTWIDGKPLYRKTYNTTSPSQTSAWVNVSMDPINDVDQMIFIASRVDVNDTRVQQIFGGYQGFGLGWNTTSKQVIVYNFYATTSNQPLLLTFYYTKTTDTATIEVPAATAATASSAAEIDLKG